MLLPFLARRMARENLGGQAEAAAEDEKWFAYQSF